MLVRKHVAVVDFTDEAITDPRAGGGAQVLTRLEYPTHPQAFPGGIRVTLTGRDPRSDFAYQRAAQRTRSHPPSSRPSSRQRRAVLADRVASLEALLTPERQSDLSAAFAPLTLRRSPAYEKRLFDDGQAEIVAAVREFVDNDAWPV